MITARSTWKARHVMHKEGIVTTRHAKGHELARQLLAAASTGVPVVELNGEVVGMLTEFDLLKAVQAGKPLDRIEAGDIMTPGPVCVSEDAPAEEVIQKMIQHRIIRIPVVKDNKLVGIISRRDILSYILEPELTALASV